MHDYTVSHTGHSTYHYIKNIYRIVYVILSVNIAEELHFKVQLKSKGKDIIFCWIPSHIGIKGNEEADEAAKEALSLNKPQR